MARKQVLLRLLRLRELEEEQGRLELESSAGIRDRVDREHQVALAQRSLGRDMFRDGIGTSDIARRNGGIVEIAFANQRRGLLEIRLNAAESELARQRVEFLNLRAARMQVETLADKVKKLEQVETDRRAQQMLDDWYGHRSSVSGKSKSVGPAGICKIENEDAL